MGVSRAFYAGSGNNRMQGAASEPPRRGGMFCQMRGGAEAAPYGVNAANRTPPLIAGSPARISV